MIPATRIRRRDRIQRLLALFVIAWLNVVIQPCMAQALAVPAGMEHCDHGGTPDHPVPCPGMQADNCIAAHDVTSEAPRAVEPPRGGATLLMLPPGSLFSLPAVIRSRLSSRDHATGPSLNIRFCNLRN